MSEKLIDKHIKIKESYDFLAKEKGLTITEIFNFGAKFKLDPDKLEKEELLKQKEKLAIETKMNNHLLEILIEEKKINDEFEKIRFEKNSLLEKEDKEKKENETNNKLIEKLRYELYEIFRFKGEKIYLKSKKKLLANKEIKKKIKNEIIKRVTKNINSLIEIRKQEEMRKKKYGINKKE